MDLLNDEGNWLISVCEAISRCKFSPLDNMLASLAGGSVGGGQVALVHSFKVTARSNGVSPHHDWFRFAF